MDSTTETKHVICEFKELEKETMVTDINIRLVDILLVWFCEEGNKNFFAGYTLKVNDEIIHTTNRLLQPVIVVAQLDRVCVERIPKGRYDVGSNVIFHMAFMNLPNFPPWGKSTPTHVGTVDAVPFRNIVFLQTSRRLIICDRLRLLDRLVHNKPLLISGLVRLGAKLSFKMNLSCLLCIHRKPLVIVNIENWVVDSLWSKHILTTCSIPHDLQRF
jgi:hypothetical protein